MGRKLEIGVAAGDITEKKIVGSKNMTAKPQIRPIVLMTEVKHRTAWNYLNNCDASSVCFNGAFYFGQTIINFFQPNLLRSCKAVIIS